MEFLLTEELVSQNGSAEDSSQGAQLRRKHDAKPTRRPEQPSSPYSEHQSHAHEVIKHAREDVEKVSEPKAQALFETTAEVLQGLVTAYQHYESASERAWQTLAVDRSYPPHNEQNDGAQKD